MFLDRILYPVTALGPGRRAAVWVSGCGRRCPQCANPELWHQYPQQEIPAEQAAAYLNTLAAERTVDGITLTGGEPFDQPLELAKFLDALKVHGDILAFSGYTLEELRSCEEKRPLVERVDVLIDGAYIDSLNDGVSTLRGSVNQRIHFLREHIREHYEAYLKEGRKIENFVYDYRTISVGIHRRE